MTDPAPPAHGTHPEPEGAPMQLRLQTADKLISGSLMRLQAASRFFSVRSPFTEFRGDRSASAQVAV